MEMYWQPNKRSGGCICLKPDGYYEIKQRSPFSYRVWWISDDDIEPLGNLFRTFNGARGRARKHWRKQSE